MFICFHVLLGEFWVDVRYLFRKGLIAGVHCISRLCFELFVCALGWLFFMKKVLILLKQHDSLE